MDIIVNKNNTQFIVPQSTDISIQNWYKNIYKTWEDDTFDIINKFASKDKIFIDIGSWVGVLSVPYSYQFSKVIAIEADKESVINFKYIVEKNNITNIDIIEKAVFDESDKKVKFGPSNFRLDLPGLNQSTSHINYSSTKPDDYDVDTITLRDITSPFLSDIGLIKIDIEGGEGYLLDDIINLIDINIPILISFHYPWIENKDKLVSFSSTIMNKKIQYYDSNYNKINISVYEYILQNNFGSILFNN